MPHCSWCQKSIPGDLRHLECKFCKLVICPEHALRINKYEVYCPAPECRRMFHNNL